jgi:hypothetical protein
MDEQRFPADYFGRILILFIINIYPNKGFIAVLFQSNRKEAQKLHQMHRTSYSTIMGYTSSVLAPQKDGQLSKPICK